MDRLHRDQPEGRAAQDAERGAELEQLRQQLAESRATKEKAEEQLRESRERLERLSRTLLEAQDMERARIARELHDEFGETLTTVRLNLEAMRRSRSDIASAPQLQECLAIVDRAIEQVRELSFDLRPSLLDDLGLAAALRSFLNQTARKANFSAELAEEGAGGGLPSSLQTTIYRVVQEAVTNIARHAKAQHVWVQLRRSRQELWLEIRDDGIGFDVNGMDEPAEGASHLGLLGMQERIRLAGGQIEILSEPGKGSTVRARLPLPPDTSERR